MGTNIQIDNNQSKRLKKVLVTYNESDGEDITYNENNGEDIISNLPESIISQILSLLPAKDVLRTCVLSKDWEYKWTCIYDIDINDEERFVLKKTRKTSFVNFVDRIFFLSLNSNLQRFRLRCRHEYNARRMISWISAALMRNVEDLEIVYNDEGVVLPGRLFYCTSLTKLKLQWPCIFRVSAQNLFSSLKILYLAKTKILGVGVPDTGKLMFDFPVLETLELQNCEWLNVNFVEINSPALTKVNVIHYSNLREVDKYQIKISGAKLAKFEFCGCFVENFDLGTSSVFSATVDFGCSSKDIQVIRKNGLQARSLLKGFSGLNHLKLSGEVVEAVWAQSEQGPPLPKFNVLKQLEVSSRCNSEALLDLLRAIPFLESITLNMCRWDDYDYDEVESVPSCIVSHLNEVQFCLFGGGRADVRMADFLLTNAIQLKKMLGLHRGSSEETQIENFWAKLKSVFKDGDFVVCSRVKNMADFELKFGRKTMQQM